MLRKNTYFSSVWKQRYHRDKTICIALTTAILDGTSMSRTSVLLDAENFERSYHYQPSSPQRACRISIDVQDEGGRRHYCLVTRFQGVADSMCNELQYWVGRCTLTLWRHRSCQSYSLPRILSGVTFNRRHRNLVGQCAGFIERPDMGHSL
jgi:hypothetical protein